MTDAPLSPAVGDLVQAWLTARAERDFDRLGSLTAPQAIWSSPVEGRRIGRSAVVEEVQRGFENTDAFDTMLLALHCGDATATARIRNIATRKGKELDSVQTLQICVEQDMVSEIHVRVDDVAAIEEFWS